MTSENLKGEMGARNLNVKKVADMLHVSQRAVYQWLDGSRKMPATAVELFRIKVLNEEK